jgi:hypothetical protein
MSNTKNEKIYLEEGQSITIVSGGQEIEITNKKVLGTETWVRPHFDWECDRSASVDRMDNRMVCVTADNLENDDAIVSIHNVKPFTKKTAKDIGSCGVIDFIEKDESKYLSSRNFCNFFIKK